jgi:hypothetical protein
MSSFLLQTDHYSRCLFSGSNGKLIFVLRVFTVRAVLEEWIKLVNRGIPEKAKMHCAHHIAVVYIVYIIKFANWYHKWIHTATVFGWCVWSYDCLPWRKHQWKIGKYCIRVTGEPDECLLSNSSSEQPDWRVKYCGDYKGSTMPVCSHDLFCWAFQVARGMEYLASRKVRQILLMYAILLWERIFIYLFMLDYIGIILKTFLALWNSLVP